MKKGTNFYYEYRLNDWAIPLSVGWWRGCGNVTGVAIHFLCFVFMFNYKK